MEKYTYLIIAVACLVVGAIIHFVSVKTGTKRNANMVLAWLLIALFPVFLIFTFFPESIAKGEIFKIEFGGAAAAFAFIWWYGTQRVIKIGDNGELTEENKKLKEKIENIESSSTGEPVRRAKPLEKTDKHTYSLKGQKNTKVGLITGDIRNVRGVDIWVNSENTNMEMARFYEGSVSAIIRYMGARKDDVGNVKEDTIADALRRKVSTNVYVQPATVLDTDSGDLGKTNDVKRILHVAAVHGEPGKGYRAVSNIKNCIKNALAKADTLDNNFQSIIFPLFGTGMANGNLESIARSLISEAVTYLKFNPDSQLRDVYFLAYTDEELEVCTNIMNKHTDLQE